MILDVGVNHEGATMSDTTPARTPARARADKLAAYAPKGAKVEIFEETGDYGDMAQIVIEGSIDKMLITISNRRSRKRTRLAACWWFRSGGKARDIRVGDVAYRIRNLYIDRRDLPVTEGAP